ncbi:MAG: protein kinase [Alphaproteobacteria bacterium]|nr:protein kinase [Alphaproteobacteria bacterium]
MDRPTRAELEQALRAFTDSLAGKPAVGRDAYLLRVAETVRAILGREAQSGAEAEQAENRRLVALLGRSGSNAALNRDLASKLRVREPLDRAALMAHLKATVADRLAIDNPRYAES